MTDDGAFVDSVSEDDLRDALRAAVENVTTLEGIRDSLTAERDRARLELQRMRERFSVELAEAKVLHARTLRAYNELALKASRLESECSYLNLKVDWHIVARRDLIQTLGDLVDAYDAEVDPEVDPGAPGTLGS